MPTFKIGDQVSIAAVRYPRWVDGLWVITPFFARELVFRLTERFAVPETRRYTITAVVDGGTAVLTWSDVE